MVFQKRSSFELNGYQIPPKARGYRSARRRRRLFRNSVEEDQMCAFELLATVAGKLLQENETKTRIEENSGKKEPKLMGSSEFYDVKLKNEIETDFQVQIRKDGNGSVGMLRQDDEDENSSGTTISSKHNVDRRIKKVSASKFWKVGPTLLTGGDFYTHDPKSTFRTRKMCCRRRQSTERCAFKRRKLTMNPEPNSNSMSLEKGRESRDHGVELRIESFLIPELFVEMSETTTVGSLKRKLSESVTAMLEHGFRVGVIVQGKMVWDDGKTLVEAGISCNGGNEKIEKLSFTLDPSSSSDSEMPCRRPESPQPLARTRVTRTPSSVCSTKSSDDTLLPPMTPPMSLRMPAGRDDGSSNSSCHSSLTKILVSVHSSSGDEAVTMVPLQSKSSKRSDLVQRRMRRPFSVTEVKALVQAVEDLGTRRWRDVKIQAFEYVQHRTYVDLKDKWKTLVHTARISPQQRRGEPVPQELLDRVLSAHARWSGHPTKFQTKQLHHQQLTMEQTQYC